MGQEKRNKIVDSGSLRTGDIILCYKNPKTLDFVGDKIRKVTNSEYTHAAICLNNEIVAESTIPFGIRRERIENLLQRYDHTAVFRQPDAWSDYRKRALNLFIDQVIKTGAKYNFSGIHKFEGNKSSHEILIYEKLAKYLSGQFTPDVPLKEKYFCSELVADCFIATGFIDPSAAVVYKSDTYSPGDLGKDPTYGTFYGYLTAKEHYDIPVDDEFYDAITFDDIYGKKQPDKSGQ